MRKYFFKYCLLVFSFCTMSFYLRTSVNDKAGCNLKTDSIKKAISFPFNLSKDVNNLDDLITSSFGNRFHPVLGKKMFHNGVDLRLHFKPVFSMLFGKVVRVGYNRFSGNYVVVQSLNGITIGYAHLSELKVYSGEFVLPGQCLGISGNTGRTTGPHLHLTVKVEGKYINPTLLLRIAFLHLREADKQSGGVVKN